MSKSKWTWLALVLGLSGCATTADESEVESDGENDTFIVDGAADAFGVSEGSDEARAILSFVNSRTARELTAAARLPKNSAENIFSYRLGKDGERYTTDDRSFTSLSSLDAIPYVGPRTFKALRDYVAAMDAIEPTTTPWFGLSCGREQSCVLPSTFEPLDHIEQAFDIIEETATQFDVNTKSEFRFLNVRFERRENGHSEATYEFYAPPPEGSNEKGYYGRIAVGAHSIHMGRMVGEDVEYPTRQQVETVVATGFQGAYFEFIGAYPDEQEVVIDLVHFYGQPIGLNTFWYRAQSIGKSGYIHASLGRLFDLSDI